MGSYKIENTAHHMVVAKAVQDFNVYDKFVDLCFICACGIKVKAHKLLLCSLSTQMKKMFMELPDCVLQDMVTIHVPDIDSGILRLVLDFLYDGSIRVSETQYMLIQDTMNTLGITLTNNSEKPSSPPPQPSLPAQPPPQVLYMSTTPNSQGEMQYIMVTQNPEQVLQNQMMSPVVQTSVREQQSAQPLIMTQACGQIMTPVEQGSTHQPMIINQTNRQQLIQGSGQLVSSQVQQNNLIPVMQQNNHIVSMGNQMVGANQNIVTSNHQLASPNQSTIVQPIMLNNNNMQVSMQNQVANSNYIVNQTAQSQQPRSQVSNLHFNQSPQASIRQFKQNAQPQSSRRGRPAKTQPSQALQSTTPSSKQGLSTEDIWLALKNNAQDVSSLTAESIQRSLESIHGVDLSIYKEEIERVLRKVKEMTKCSEKAATSTNTLRNEEGNPKQRKKPSNRKKKRSFAFPKSDDECDEDFDPKAGNKPSKKKKKEKSNWFK